MVRYTFYSIHFSLVVLFPFSLLSVCVCVCGRSSLLKKRKRSERTRKTMRKQPEKERKEKQQQTSASARATPIQSRNHAHTPIVYTIHISPIPHLSHCKLLLHRLHPSPSFLFPSPFSFSPPFIRFGLGRIRIDSTEWDWSHSLE